MPPASREPDSPEGSRADPCLVIVSGPPGSGKTTLARRLARDLELPCFTKDDIKERLFDTLGWSDRDWSRRLGRATMAVLYQVLAAELAAGRACLVESNFRPAFANADLRALQAQYPFRPIQIQCHSDGPVLLARFAARAASGTRHPGHDDRQNTAELAADLRQGHYPDLDLAGPVFHLDTTDFARLDYAALLGDVRRAMAPSGVAGPRRASA